MTHAFDLDGYIEATVWASPWMADPHLQNYPLRLSQIPDVSTAVYVAFDADGRVRYVGSIARAKPGLVDRFREHLASRRQAQWWTYIWVIELLPDTPIATVRWLEGVVGRTLEPTDNRRLPVVC